MTDQLSWSAAGEWLAGFAPVGPLRTAVLLVYGLCAAVAPFIYKYYLGVLAQGAQPEGSLERQDYDKLRAGLAGGNLAARLYAKWLIAFLDGVERFFGDTGLADRTLFPRAFGLKTPAPLWTAPAFDCCLLLASTYPVVTIFLIWAISGQVGPAEAALGLSPNLAFWWRGSIIAAIGFSNFAYWHGAPTRGPNYLVWRIVALTVAFEVAFAVAAQSPSAGAGGIAGAAAIYAATAGAVAIAGAHNGVGPVVVAISIIGAFAVAIYGPSTGAGGVAVYGLSADAGGVVGAANIAGAVTFVTVWLSPAAIKQRWQGFSSPSCFQQ